MADKSERLDGTRGADAPPRAAVAGLNGAQARHAGAARASIGWLAALALVAGVAAFAWGPGEARAGGAAAVRQGPPSNLPAPVVVPPDQVTVSLGGGGHRRGGRGPAHGPSGGVTYRVQATNVGAAAYGGPILLVMDRLDAHARLHDPCGHLPDGRAYVCLQRFGIWGPGDTTPTAFVHLQALPGARVGWQVQAVPAGGPPNTAPVADAGPDQGVSPGVVVTLDGSASSDADGDSLAFTWVLDGRPDGSAAALSDPNAVRPTFVVDVPGTYTAVLTVNDGRADSAPDTVAVSTLNMAPVADAGPDQPAFVTDTVTLDGSGSSDVDGDALTFDWLLTRRPDGSAAVLSDPGAMTPTFVVDLPGTYEAELVVSDGQADSAPDTVVVTTLNSPPQAAAGPDQGVPLGAVVQLDGSGSFDVDGDPLTYRWALTARPDGSAAALSDPAAEAPRFVADRAGTYAVQLVVNDGIVDSDPDTAAIGTEDARPVADAGPDRSAQVGDPVTLDGGLSSDPDGDPLAFAWAITVRPAGSTAQLDDPSAVTPTLVPDVAGDYLAQLIVSDGVLESDPDTALLQVSPAVTESVTVFARSIRTVGAGLQNYCCIAILSTADHGGVTLRIRSEDPSLARVAPDGTTAGTAYIDVPVPDGTTNVGFWVQGVEGATGVATLTASVPGFADGTNTVSVVQAGLAIKNLATGTTAGAVNDPFQVQVGVPDSTGSTLAVVQAVRYGAGPLLVTVGSADPAVGRVVTSTEAGPSVAVPIQPGATVSASLVSMGGVAFDPLAAGTTVVDAAAPDLLTTAAGSVAVTVSP